MKILLLGMNGQVGWELQRSLAPLGELVALDFDSPGPLAADFTQPEALAATVRAVAPQIIVNAAAHTAVDKAEAEPELARTINAEAPAVLAREAQALGAWLVHYSTDYVFDGSGTAPWREDSPTGPLSVYGQHQARRRAGHPRQRLPSPDPAHQLGLCGTRRQLRAHHAAPGRRARPAERHRRPDRRADRCRSAGRRHCACAARRAWRNPQLGGTYHAVAAGETSWHGYARHVIEFARAAGQPVRVQADRHCGRAEQRLPDGCATAAQFQARHAQAAARLRPDLARLAHWAWTGCCAKCWADASIPDDTNMNTTTTPRRGIVLAGGSGTRLHPATLAMSKQLLPVYDKPMVYYPLATLMLAGIRDILLISTPQDTPRFQALLGDGSQWGVNLSLLRAAQPRRPGAGLHPGQVLRQRPAERAGAGRQHLLRPRLPGPAAQRRRAHRAAPRCSPITCTTRERYGVVAFDSHRRALSIEEKPAAPKSNYAVTGLYFYDEQVCDIAASIRPVGARRTRDHRGQCALPASRRSSKSRSWAAATPGSTPARTTACSRPAQFIATLEKRQGLKVACPEEIAFRAGWITREQLEALAQPMLKNGYGQYLMQVAGSQAF